MEKEVLESLGKGRVGKCEWSGSSSSCIKKASQEDSGNCTW